MTISSSRLDLRRWLEQQTGGEKLEPLKVLMSRCKNKKFYCGIHPSKVADCCFWHIIGPPRKPDGTPSPLYEFQQKIIEDALLYKKLAVVKSRNLGLTALAIYFSLFLVMSKQLPGNYMFVTGIGHVLSSELCRRIKNIFKTNHEIYFDDNMSTISFPNARFGFYGSDSSAYRGQESVTFVLADELGEFEEDPMPSLDTYSIKNSGAFLWLVTTPTSKIDHFAFRLFNEPNDAKVLYKRLYLPYTVGLDTILNRDAIQLLKQSSLSFNAEYALEWGSGQLGNLLPTDSLIEAFKEDYPLDPAEYAFTAKSCGIDPGGVNTAMCVLAYHKPSQKIRCLYSHIWSRPGLEVNSEIWSIIQKFGVQRVYIDGANVPETQSLMEKFQDPCFPNYRQTVDYFKNVNKPYSLEHWQDHFHVRPISFSEQGRTMLINLKQLMINSLISFHPTQKEMYNALVSCKIKDGFALDKSIAGHDLIDSVRLAALSFKYRTNINND
jgi:hypothetical protein